MKNEFLGIPIFNWKFLKSWIFWTATIIMFIVLYLKYKVT